MQYAPTGGSLLLGGEPADDARKLLIDLELRFVDEPAEAGEAVDVWVVDVAEEVGLAGAAFGPGWFCLQVDVDGRLAVVGEANAGDRFFELGTAGCLERVL